MFVPVSSKNTVHPINFLTDVSDEQTNEIKATTEGKNFTPVNPRGNLPDKFFSDFLKRQGLKLEGAEEINSLRKSSDGRGLDKAQLEELYEGLQSGVVRFVLRSEGEE